MKSRFMKSRFIKRNIILIICAALFLCMEPVAVLAAESGGIIEEKSEAVSENDIKSISEDSYNSNLIEVTDEIVVSDDRIEDDTDPYLTSTLDRGAIVDETIESDLYTKEDNAEGDSAGYETVGCLRVSLGASHSAAIDESGNLWTWGYNYRGQLGNGTTTDSAVPIQIKAGTKFKALSLGYEHSAAIDESGNLWIWGYNYYGQLGNGTTTDSPVPIQIKAGTKFKAVSLGGEHSAAIDEDGNLWTWGENFFGQVGNGTTDNSSVPVQIKVGTKFKAVSLGEYHSAAIDESGNLWAWGDIYYGQVGNGTTTDSAVPIQIKAGTKFKALSLGGDSSNSDSAAIDESGNLWAWGSNYCGQLGNGTTTDSPVPIQIKADTKFKAVDLGPKHSAAIDEDGNLWTWGSNDSGQLGNGAGGTGYLDSSKDSAVPVHIKAGTKFKEVSLGYYHSAAIDEDGNLWTWGSNDSGQLGDGLKEEAVLYPKMIKIGAASNEEEAEVSTVSLNKTERTVKLGEAFSLNARAFDADGKSLPGRDIEWSSSDTAVAAVLNGYVRTVSAGEADITASCEGKTATCHVTVYDDTIDRYPESISDDSTDIWVTGLESSYAYNGAAIKPAIKVYKGKTRLTEKTDYTLKYSNNTNPGTASVIIKMKGNYTGSETVSFEITRADLSSDVTADTVVVAYKKNKTQKPVPVLYVDGRKLKYGKNDISFSYPSAGDNAYIDKGTYTIKLEAKPDSKLVTGSMEVDLKIADSPKFMDVVTITPSSKSVAYNNETAVSPDFTLKYKNTPLTEGEDYIVTYNDSHKSVGSHSVTFTGISPGYFGSKTFTFKITGKYDLANSELASIDVASSCPYALGGAKPEVTVKYNGNVLKAGKEYKVTYSNHKAAGNTAKVIIKGIGSYKGTVKKTYTVTKKDINELCLHLGDRAYSANKNDYKKVSVLFTDADYVDQKLKAGKDFNLEYVGTYDAAPAEGTEIKVTISGQGNYTGEINTSYRIINKDYDFTKAGVTVNSGKAYDYTGSEVKPEMSDLTVTTGKDKTPLDQGNYEILGYYNNVNRSNNAYIKLRGKGDYAGVKIVKFKIAATPLERVWGGLFNL